MLQFWYYIHFLKCEFFSARIQNGNNRIYQLFFIAFKRYQQYFSDIIISFLNKGTTALLCSKPQSSQNMGIGCWTTFFFCRRPSDKSLCIVYCSFKHCLQSTSRQQDTLSFPKHEIHVLFSSYVSSSLCPFSVSFSRKKAAENALTHFLPPVPLFFT